MTPGKERTDVRNEARLRRMTLPRNDVRFGAFLESSTLHAHHVQARREWVHARLRLTAVPDCRARGTVKRYGRIQMSVLKTPA